MFRKEPPKQNVAGKVAIGAAITAVAGYLAGVLTAPKSGKETREELKVKAGETYGAAEKELKQLHTELNASLSEAASKIKDLSGKASKALDEAVSKGKVAKEKAREALTGLHEGEVEDKDLRKAIAEATRAVENLRNYLKK
ncbi:YtxH domain-containing protein [Candidatus Saccharibacteria bacterium]|nr:YtxH domain-containing protein [Candidatus Saccharibacteria bacterium]